jgi:hypothetical protein
LALEAFLNRNAVTQLLLQLQHAAAVDV